MHRPIDLDDLFTYHAPSDAQRVSLEAINTAARAFAQTVLDHTPQGADQSAAIRKIREARMTANAAIVCGSGTPPERKAPEVTIDMRGTTLVADEAEVLARAAGVAPESPVALAHQHGLAYRGIIAAGEFADRHEFEAPFQHLVLTAIISEDALRALAAERGAPVVFFTQVRSTEASPRDTARIYSSVAHNLGEVREVMIEHADAHL